MKTTTTVLTAMFLSTAAMAAQNTGTQQTGAMDAQQQSRTGTQMQGNQQVNPRQLADDTWVTLSGTVKTASANSFQLQYGANKTITVEMDDWDTVPDGQFIRSGDQVMVSGRVDDDLFERTSIEAENVYIENLNTHFMAPSAADEETVQLTAIPVISAETVTLSGTVSEVQEGSFTIEAGTNEVTLNVADMRENPLDDEGFLQIDQGDRVIVNGVAGPAFLTNRTLDVTSIVEIETNPTGTAAVGSPDATGTTGQGAGASMNSSANESAASRRAKTDS